MIREVVNMIENLSPILNFTSGLVVFLGGGYVALHSREIPKWVMTCLWYTGLLGLLVSLTITVEWVYGDLHPLSHFQIGRSIETLLLLSLAITVGIMFFNTVWKDYLGAKSRACMARVLGKSPPPPRKTRSSPVRKKTTKSTESVRVTRKS
jgi:hypothetical protein